MSVSNLSNNVHSLAGRLTAYMYTSGMHAKEPTRETNLSRSFDPAHAIAAHITTIRNLKMFFFHLIHGLYFPVLENNCWLVISMAG